MGGQYGDEVSLADTDFFASKATSRFHWVPGLGTLSWTRIWFGYIIDKRALKNIRNDKVTFFE
jgi:hypothetical protein